MLVTYGDDSMADVQVCQLEEQELIRPPAFLSGTETKCLRASALIFLPHDLFEFCGTYLRPLVR